MVLEDITKGADLLVERAAVADSELLRHRDLHALHVLCVPDRLQKRVGESEIQDVLHGLLAEEMVDAKDSRIGKRLVEYRIESSGGSEVTTERLFHDHAAMRGASGAGQAGRDRAKQLRWDREIEQRPLGRPQRPYQTIEGCRLTVVARHVREPCDQLSKCLFVHAAMRGDALSRPSPKLFGRPVGHGDAHDGDIQAAMTHHCLQSGKDLLVREITGRPEQHQGIRVRFRHDRSKAYRGQGLPWRWSPGKVRQLSSVQSVMTWTRQA